MSNPWFRMYAEFVNDPKVQMMSEANQRRLVMLFCCRCNGHVTLQDEEVTFLLRISNDEWKQTKQIFVDKGFIDEANNLLNWDKRQFASDKSNDRVARYREKQKELKNKEKSDTCDDVTSGNDTSIVGDDGSVTDVKRYSNGIDTEQIQIQNRTEDKDLLQADACGLSDEQKSRSLPCPYEKFVDVYHKHFPEGSRVKIISEERKRHIKSRWNEAARLKVHPFGYATVDDGLKAWAEFFHVCRGSDFLTGKIKPSEPNRKIFTADLDFFLQPRRFVSCLEDKYHRDQP